MNRLESFHAHVSEFNRGDGDTGNLTIKRFEADPDHAALGNALAYMVVFVTKLAADDWVRVYDMVEATPWRWWRRLRGFIPGIRSHPSKVMFGTLLEHFEFKDKLVTCWSCDGRTDAECNSIGESLRDKYNLRPLENIHLRL